MKKESKQGTLELEALYGIDKYKTGVYTNEMLKEFRKYLDKLQRIAKYEESAKVGKEISEEMKDLISKKEIFVSHINSLKKAMEIYEKAYSKVPPEVAAHPVPEKSIKAEIQGKAKELLHETLQELGQFVAIGALLSEKEHANKDLFPAGASLTPEEQATLLSLFNELFKGREDVQTTLLDRAKSCTEQLTSIAITPAILKLLEKVKKNGILMGTSYMISKKGESHVLQAAPAEPKKLIPQQNIANVSIQSKPVPEAKPVEHIQHYEEVKKKAEESKWVNSSKEVEVVEKQAPKKEAAPVMPVLEVYDINAPEVVEEDGFQVAKDKKEKRDEKLAEFTVKRRKQREQDTGFQFARTKKDRRDERVVERGTRGTRGYRRRAGADFRGGRPNEEARPATEAK